MFEFLLTILTIIFVVLLLSVALTFGFFLLMWFVGTAVAVSLFIVLRSWWRRAMFLYRGRAAYPKAPPPIRKPPRPTAVIEAEYEELPPRE